MSAPLPIFESRATYYNSSFKKWISGTFTLNNTRLQFQADDNQKEQELKLPLSTICGIEKKQSSFIYAALVVTVGSEKHWFSSFLNRDTVYNLLELFWRQSLISASSIRSSPKPKTGNSILGKELLGILHESECTLVDAANALSEQGKQLQESQVVIEDMNSDLTVAQRVLQNMNMRFSTVLTGLASPKSNAEEQVTDESARQKHFRVTYTFTKSSDACSWQQGTLVVSNNFTLMDEQQNKKLTVTYGELEKFEILSPWEFCLTYSTSWVTKECYFMCPQLSSLLKFLNTFPSLKRKIILNEEDDAPSLDTPSCSRATSSRSSPNSPPPIIALDQTPDSPDTKSAQTQILAEDAVITDEDMAEISNVLNSLQSLATEVSREQQNQMEKINSLISNVDQTELRVNEQNKVIKKSM